MERARQLVGEMLLYCFAVVALTGGFLAFYYVPDGREVFYNGSYTPLHGVPMSAAYHSALDLSFDVRGGLLMRQLHLESTVVLFLGTVVWVVLGRLRYSLALATLGFVVLGGIGGYGAADDLMFGTVLGRVPIVAWYGLHLAMALAVGAALVTASRRETAQRPRTLGFTALSIALAVLAIFWL
jgi:quinol-cytochrome oxidoreductase complex cytochrome b subunit